MNKFDGMVGINLDTKKRYKNSYEVMKQTEHYYYYNLYEYGDGDPNATAAAQAEIDAFFAEYNAPTSAYTPSSTNYGTTVTASSPSSSSSSSCFSSFGQIGGSCRRL